MKRLNRNSNDSIKPSDPGNAAVYRVPVMKCGLNPMKLMGFVVVILMGLSVLFSAYVILKDPPSDSIWAGAEARVIEVKPQKDEYFPRHFDVTKDKLLGGLLAAGFDEKSCLSRYQSVLYRKEVPFKPSSYLISKLRNYESLHKRCGPYTESYNKTLETLSSKKQPNDPSECNYVVWISFSGLGNRILTLASAFLYALLTDRVLLVDRGTDIPDLFCEPFPDVSWLLPSDFPIIKEFEKFDQKSPDCYGKMLKSNDLSKKAFSPFLYLHLVHDYDDQDKLFFCDQDQSFFKKVPWLVLKTDNYFIPSLFLIPSFEKELNSLFPEKETVFHFLGRYLLHPTNQVWGLITRYYNSYLAHANEKIGIQIRVFDTGTGPFKHVLDQILSCAVNEKLLPEIDRSDSSESVFNSPENRKTKAVLMTSLNSGYFEAMRDMYWEYPIVNGDVIGIYQPSHEEYQQTEKQTHNRKAWAEMYLLSLTDKLVTSSWSTFGYVAQSLGGLRPWILNKPENRTVPDPPCQRAVSIEPCFHAPPFYDCKRRVGIDTGAVVAHVRHCEDMSWGLKLVDRHDEL